MERTSVVIEAVVGLAVIAALVSEAGVWWSGGRSDSQEVGLWQSSAVARWQLQLIDHDEGPVFQHPIEKYIGVLLLLCFLFINYILGEETYRCQVDNPTLDSSPPESQTTPLGTAPLDPLRINKTLGEETYRCQVDNSTLDSSPPESQTTPLGTDPLDPLRINKTSNFTMKKTELVKVFSNLLEEYKPQIQEKINSLRLIADEMQGINKDVAIAKITGNAAGIVGGVCTVIGFALIPVTFGASTILSGVGIGIGAAGGATNIGAVISKGAMFKNRLNKAKVFTDDINTLMKELYEILNSLKEVIALCPENDLGQLGIDITADILKVLPFMQGIGTNIVKIVVGESVEVSGKAAPKIFQAVGGAVFAGAFVIWDIVNIVNNAKELGVNYQPEAGKTIRDMASSMEKSLGDLETLEESLKNI